MNLSSSDRAVVCYLADRLGVDRADLLQALEEGPENFYVRSEVPKRSGGTRVLYKPQQPLISIQHAIKKRLLVRLKVSPIAHAYVKGRSIETNAYPHWQSRSMFVLDLKNAYNHASFQDTFIEKSITERYWKGWTLVFIYGREWWKELGIEFNFAKLVELLTDMNEKGHSFLPQGAPTSPDLFNRACRELDRRLERLADHTGCVVTRYADNIFFSSPEPTIDAPIRRALERMVNRCGFVVNDKKTQYITDGNRLGVPLRLPGINIMEGDFYIPRKSLRHMRMAMYCAAKAGNSAIYYGYKGAAIQAVSELPPQLRGLYAKAIESDF